MPVIPSHQEYSKEVAERMNGGKLFFITKDGKRAVKFNIPQGCYEFSEETMSIEQKLELVSEPAEFVAVAPFYIFYSSEGVPLICGAVSDLVHKSKEVFGYNSTIEILPSTSFDKNNSTWWRDLVKVIFKKEETDDSN